MMPWDIISEDIASATGRRFHLESRSAMGGGCINQSYCVAGGGSRYFVKLNDADRLEMFEAEAAGLRELDRAAVLHVPVVICWGAAADASYLVLEYLDLGGGTESGMERLGYQLAALHRVTHAQFGWHRDNTIGSTPQNNRYAGDWVEFWRTQRLAYQLELAAQQGYGGRLQRLGERLLADLDKFFENYTPAASLLHGDLWSGNVAMNPHGDPVIFDPAVYYGDREADLAMTELFGGFGRRFYHAYREAYPLDSGYEARKTLYNLYQVLNHLNLFGGGYLSQSERMMESLLEF